MLSAQLKNISELQQSLIKLETNMDSQQSPRTRKTPGEGEADSTSSQSFHTWCVSVENLYRTGQEWRAGEAELHERQ